LWGNISKWHECSTIFKVNGRKSTRNIGIDHPEAKKAAPQVKACASFLYIQSNMVRLSFAFLSLKEPKRANTMAGPESLLNQSHTILVWICAGKA